MSRFIRCGKDYINLANILKWEITGADQTWKATMTLKEYKSDGFMVGSAVFGIGWNNGKHRKHDWEFDSEKQAHAFVQRKLEPFMT